jgi:hypothetical protein
MRQFTGYAISTHVPMGEQPTASFFVDSESR